MRLKIISEVEGILNDRAGTQPNDVLNRFAHQYCAFQMTKAAECAIAVSEGD